jgi:filamentous hemagglutinin
VYNWSKKNKHRTERSDTAEVGSVIMTTGDNTIVADDAVNVRAGNLIADQNLIVAADRINVEAGRATHDDYSETYTKKKGFLSSRTSHSISQNHADTTVGSQLVGDTVTTLSTGDTTIKGSTVFGTNGVDMISTDGNINLQTSEDRFNNYNYRKDTKSGFGALGGLSFGKMSNEQGRTGDQIGHTGSTIASLNGDVNLSARQGSINVQASDINSQNANVDLRAQQINLTDVHNTATVDQYTKYKSAGLSVSASVAGINAVQNTAQAGDLLGQAAFIRLNRARSVNDFLVY